MSVKFYAVKRGDSLYVRLIFEGQNIEFSTKQKYSKTSVREWKKRFKIEYNIQKSFNSFSLEDFRKNMFPEKVEKKVSLNLNLNYLHQFFKYYLKEIEINVGITKTAAHYTKYKTIYKYCKGFSNDVLLSSLNVKYLKDFNAYLIERGLKHNTAYRYCKFLKTVVFAAQAEGLLRFNPFAGYRLRKLPTKVIFLDECDLEKIENTCFTIKHYEEVRLAFLLQCYTGVSYTDIKKLLNPDNIKVINGRKWFISERSKTEIAINVPLYPKTLEILEANPKLHIQANQRMNLYLKYIQKELDIKTNLTTHLARRTFATHTLSKGVSIESVSKMLGHSNIQITQQAYAVLNKNWILHEMDKVFL